MNREEIEDIIGRLSAFRKEYRMLISEVAIDHMDATAVLLHTVAQLAANSSPVPHPSNRVNGMCPCELADAIKKAGCQHMTDTYPVGPPSNPTPPPPPPPAN